MPRRRTLLGALGLLVALACQPAPTTPERPPAPTGALAPGSTAENAPGPTPERPPAVQKLTIAIVSPNPPFAIPWLAQETGIFARHGFEAEVPLVAGSPRVTQSLIAGDFDYAIPGATALIRARLAGADTTILATSSNRVSGFKVLVHPKSGIGSLPELRSRTVAVTQYGSDADTFLRILISRVGLTSDDLTILQHGGSPQGAAALLSGNLDAAVIGGSAVSTAEQGGMISIASARDYLIPSATGTIATTRSYIERDRASVQRFMDAYVEAIHFYKTHRDETIRILQKYMADMPLDEVVDLYDEALENFQPLPFPSDEAIQAAIDREVETTPEAKDFKPSDFVDSSFLRDVEQRGVIERLYR
ncbi:MAG TPA: ABC transporter substrate-binding protein [Chloroflexota bacterium]|jgi:ABC-type nitrate/sulfonate/bicarbonate transport system substrate-binding protein